MYLTFQKCPVDKISKVIKIWITKNLFKLSECLGEKERKIENQAIEELRKLRTYQNFL